MSSQETDHIYVDHHATTPTDDQVVAEMEPVFTQNFGNPASDDNHRMGQKASTLVQEAREQIVDSIGARRTKEIIFTSGATESDNLAIKSTMRHARSQGNGSHIVTAATEHEAVLEACKYLSEEGFTVTTLPVDEHGLVDPADLEAAIQEDTVIVTIMSANNEVGTIAPLKEIGTITSQHDVIFHTDAVQAIGYLDFDVDALEIDMMSISGHKIYGPNGIGALYADYDLNIQHMDPIFHGGGHERGLRSGSLNVPGAVGLGKAMELAEQNRDERSARIERLRDRLWTRLNNELDQIKLNGHPEHRLPNNLNVSFIGVDNQRLLGRLSNDGVYAASGSACSTTDSSNNDEGKTHEVRESHVLQAMFDDDDRIQSAIRFGLGKDNTKSQIDQAAERIVDNVERLRKFNRM